MTDNQRHRVGSDWVRAYSAANPMEAELLVGMLAQHGIRTGLRSQGLMGGIGELPLDALHTPVWVAPQDLNDARTLLQAYERKPEHASWVCPACGEHNEGNFEICWHCGAERE